MSTRSNVNITLSDGKKIFFVLDSSSAPEQGYAVENVILPLLDANDSTKEMAIINEHSDSIGEKRVNATYRYVIDLQTKKVSFYEENYNWNTDVFHRGKDLTKERYLPYVESIKQSI